MSKHRDVMASSFSADDVEDIESSDPMSGLSNLADCMLVLACGLMITLVVHWNLNVTPHMEAVEETGDLVEIAEDEEPQLVVQSEGGDEDEGEGGDTTVYENMGVLYRDPDSGKMYYLREWEE